MPLVQADRGRVLLSTVTPTSVEFGFAPPKTDRAWDDLPLVMHGVQYARGIGMHAPCSMSYAVPAGAAEFRALVGVSDGVRQCGRADVVFELRDQDGRMLGLDRAAHAGPTAPRVDDSANRRHDPHAGRRRGAATAAIVTTPTG